MKMEKGQAVETNGVTGDVASLSIQDTPKPKSKNLNVLEEFRKAKMKNAASFVVVGVLRYQIDGLLTANIW
jgi:elongation factor 1 alpha-like protein